MKIAVVGEQNHVAAPPVNEPVFKLGQVIPDALIEELKVGCFVSKVF